jgi:hypothetical protein
MNLKIICVAAAHINPLRRRWLVRDKRMTLLNG